MLVIKHLTVQVGAKVIIHDLSLTLKPGQIHALMGPNGSGKTSLAAALMGHPFYQISPGGSISLDKLELIGLSPDHRSQAGLFLGFQSPVAIEGVSVQNFLKTAYEIGHCRDCATHKHCPRLSVSEFRHLLTTEAAKLGLTPEFLSRSINSGFSGGERKRLEVLQLTILKPKYALLDETDSGLDIDALKLVARRLQQLVTDSRLGLMVITHYRRLLDYLKPDTVSVMVHGQLVRSGSAAIVSEIEAGGYAAFK